jgi:hypothetical protein
MNHPCHETKEWQTHHGNKYYTFKGKVNRMENGNPMEGIFRDTIPYRLAVGKKLLK